MAFWIEQEDEEYERKLEVERLMQFYAADLEVDPPAWAKWHEFDGTVPLPEPWESRARESATQ